MVTAVKVLDRHRFEARARVFDVLALGLLVTAGALLAIMLYKLGFSAGEAARTGAGVMERDRDFALSIAMGAISTASLCWLAYRAFSRRDA